MKKGIIRNTKFTGTKGYTYYTPVTALGRNIRVENANNIIREKNLIGIAVRRPVGDPNLDITSSGEPLVNPVVFATSSLTLGRSTNSKYTDLSLDIIAKWTEEADFFPVDSEVDLSDSFFTVGNTAAIVEGEVFETFFLYEDIEGERYHVKNRL